MDSTTSSPEATAGPLDDLATLTAAVDGLAARDLTGLADGVRAERVLVLRRLVDRLEGQWLRELAGVDARGAAGADHGTQAPSTASWLRGRLHLGASTATSAVRTAQALFAGPSPQPPRPCAPASSRPPTPACWPTAPTTPRPHHGRGRAGAGGRGPPAGPTRLRRAIRHLHLVADPDGGFQPGRAAPRATRVVVGPHLGGHGRPPRPARPRGRPHPAGRPGALARPHNANDPEQRPAPRRRPDRAGPPPPGAWPAAPWSRSAAPDRRGPAPADRHRGPGQPPRPPTCSRRGAWLGGAASGRRPAGGWPVTGP